MSISLKFRSWFTMIAKMRAMTVAVVPLTMLLLIASGCSPASQNPSLVLVGSVTPLALDGRDELAVGVKSLELHDIHGVETQPYMVFLDLEHPITQRQFSAINERWDTNHNSLYLKVQTTGAPALDYHYQGRLLGFKIVEYGQRVEVLNGFTEFD